MAWAGALVGGMLVVQAGITLGQVGFLRLLDSATDPLTFVSRYGTLLKWVVYPTAAMCGGLFVGLSRRWLGGGWVTVCGTLLPLWITWSQLGLSRVEMALMCGLYTAVALAAFRVAMIGKRADSIAALER